MVPNKQPKIKADPLSFNAEYRKKIPGRKKISPKINLKRTSPELKYIFVFC